MQYFKDNIKGDYINSELNRIKLLIVSLLIALAIMSLLLFYMPNVSGFFQNPKSRKIVVSWVLFFLLYELFVLWFTKRFLINGRIRFNGFKFINVIIESLFPGILLILICWIESTPRFLDSPLFLLYFILIILSTLHLNVRLVFLTAFVSSIVHFLATTWAISSFDPDFNTMYFHPFLYQVRSVFIFMAGLGAMFVTSEIKKRIHLINELGTEKVKVEGLFSQQVSAQVVESLLNIPDKKNSFFATILFFDIRNFTSFAEHNDPDVVIEFQNKIFQPLIDLVHSHNGIINQILGDGFMATFGAPVENVKHSKNALDCALKIKQVIDDLCLNAIIPDTKFGIGIHSGSVITGNIGNEQRKQFSVIGKAVITAARLEQLNKELNTSILISADCYEHVSHLDYTFKEHNKIQLKGFKDSLVVYSVSE